VCGVDPPVKITGVLAHSDPTIKKLVRDALTVVVRSATA
jgi:hypothetical protein